jgi:hypothetical protein
MAPAFEGPAEAWRTLARLSQPPPAVTASIPAVPALALGAVVLASTGCIIRVPRKDCGPDIPDDKVELAFALCGRLGTSPRTHVECLAAQQRLGALPPEELDLERLSSRLDRLRRAGIVSSWRISGDRVTLHVELTAASEEDGPPLSATARLMKEIPDCTANWDFPFLIPMHTPTPERLADLYFCHLKRRWDRDACVEVTRDGEVVAHECLDLDHRP